MRESKSGDKKSRFKGLTAVFGLLCLAGGYYISLTTKDPMKSISKFVYSRNLGNNRNLFSFFCNYFYGIGHSKKEQGLLL